MQNAEAMELTGIQVTDVSGQRRFSLSALAGDTTVTEMLQSIVGKMGLPRNDQAGRPLLYRARLHREGRHLDGRELVGHSLRENDEVQLHPSVDAGGGQ
jgi:hypothetical protein